QLPGQVLRARAQEEREAGVQHLLDGPGEAQADRDLARAGEVREGQRRRAPLRVPCGCRRDQEMNGEVQAVHAEAAEPVELGEGDGIACEDAVRRSRLAATRPRIRERL